MDDLNSCRRRYPNFPQGKNLENQSRENLIYKIGSSDKNDQVK